MTPFDPTQLAKERGDERFANKMVNDNDSDDDFAARKKNKRRGRKDKYFAEIEDEESYLKGQKRDNLSDEDDLEDLEEEILEDQNEHNLNSTQPQQELFEAENAYGEMAVPEEQPDG